MDGSCSLQQDVDAKQKQPQQELSLVDELRIENHLLEQYRKQKNEDAANETSTQLNEISFPIEFKLQIAIEALSQLTNTLETRKEAANKLICTLKVMLQEVDLRISDIQRNAHDFHKEVVEGGKYTTNTERYKAEKFVRYIKQKLLEQESTLDKLTLKNNTLLTRKHKLELRLNREEDTSFHLIDYHQMQIRHKQVKEQQEAMASKVALRKIAFEKSKKHVDNLQAQFQELKSKCNSNEKAVVMREAYLERLDEMVYRYEAEKEWDQEATGPDINEYIMQKAEIYELREKIKAMERKVELARRTSRTKKKEQLNGGDTSGQSTMSAIRSRPARWTHQGNIFL